MYVEGILSRSDSEMAKDILRNETPDPMGIFLFSVTLLLSLFIFPVIHNKYNGENTASAYWPQSREFL